MGAHVASLPMYDWVEVRSATDELWGRIAAELIDLFPGTPPELTRTKPYASIWSDPHLLLGQTCGTNALSELAGSVEILGSLVFGGLDCDPGDYYSVIIARTDSAASRLEDLQGAVVAYNNPSSFSGYMSLLVTLADRRLPVPFFRAAFGTGAHRRSIQAVAEGRADVAAVDAASWQIARTHEPAATAVKVVDRTSPMPGVPMITSADLADHRMVINEAITRAVAEMDDEAAEALDIAGYRTRTRAEYEPMAGAIATAHGAGHHQL